MKKSEKENIQKQFAEAVNMTEKVGGHVHRHLAQRPEGEVRNTRWRYSLMNWGHDPLKKR